MKYNYYKLKNDILFSLDYYPELEKTTEAQAEVSEKLYVLNRLDTKKSRGSYLVTSPFLLHINSETTDILKNNYHIERDLPQWLYEKIKNGNVVSINTNYTEWQSFIKNATPKKWRINIAGLGDVGGTIVTGLRLLGGCDIAEIGIFDIDENKIKRWEWETNQVFYSMNGIDLYPKVKSISQQDIFDCDMFIFCVTVGVPELGETKDVRILQFEGNAKILKKYAQQATTDNFKGIFAVVSDPVDLLCKTALLESNLLPEQIRGYGLGVMYARAAYYARQLSDYTSFLSEGRAFGPHGEWLVIADSIENYNSETSLLLTEKARNANLEIRAAGYKPFIAPAYSSGVLALLATIKGDWNYSATYVGGVYLGCKNRIYNSVIELETLDIPPALFDRINYTYKKLEEML